MSYKYFDIFVMNTNLIVGNMVLKEGVVAILVLADGVPNLWQMLLPSRYVDYVADGKPQW